MTMVRLSPLIAVPILLSLPGCIAVTAVTTTARIGVSAASTAVDVTGDVVGGAARTVTGGGSDDSD